MTKSVLKRSYFSIFFLKYFAKPLLQSIVLVQFFVRTTFCDQTSSVLGQIWISIFRCHYSFPIDSSRVTAGHEIEIAASSIFLSFFKLVDSGLVSKPYSLLLHAKKKPFECSDNVRRPSLYYVSKVTWWVGSEKWQFLLTFSTIYADVGLVGGSDKVQKCGDVI